jgi:predicted house-cleaning noncanonical NTP pyrophosphatase (MazG superfamily)
VDKLEFTNLVKEVVSEAAIEDTIENLNDPPGRKPDEHLVAQSEWFKALSQKDRDMVCKVISEAVHESVFGFLCVLDGVRSISGSGESNDLILSHGGVQLNEASGELLHDIYNNV